MADTNIAISGTPIFAGDPRAAGLNLPPGYQVATPDQAGLGSGPSTAGTYYNDNLNAWLVPSVAPLAIQTGAKITGPGNTGNTSGGNGTNSFVPNTIKLAVPTQTVPNPIHEFPSWTYAWSLWWLDTEDYNAMTQGADVGTGMAYNLGPNSYVVAEDSGLYPNRRLPTTLGLNYNIQNVEFTTVVGLNSTTKSSNLTEGTITVVEPYGVTLVDCLVQAGSKNYLTQPYMLQLEFKGYDSNGDPLPDSATSVYKKRFPIRIMGIKVAVTNKGAEYKISFYPINHQPLRPEHSTTPKHLTIIAGTVQEFFDDFTTKVNKHWQTEAATARAQFADTIKFDIDPTIAASKIVYNKQMQVTKGNPTKAGIELTSSSFNIPAGTQIIDVIHKVIIQSSFIVDQLGLDLQSATDSQIQSSLTQVLNTYKTTPGVVFAGADASGVLTPNAFDNVRGYHSLQFTYNIHQYSVYDPNHPAGPQFTDSRPYTVKSYNYLYTGKNIDVIDLKINFDTTYYNAINTYTNQFAAGNPTASTALDTTLSTTGTILLSPQLLAASGGSFSVFGQIPNLTPLRYKNITGDQRDTGMNIIDNPAAQTSANLHRSLYSRPSGDMVQLDMQIVGDPTLLKQDDWLYSPSPTKSSIFNSWSSQSSFAQQYGHIRMDNGALIVSVTVNTPIDIDTDWTNTGGVFPTPGKYQSLFSGQYKVLKIKNTFANGKFEQTLNMVRLMNSDYVTRAKPDTATNGRDPVNSNQNNQNNINNPVQNIDNNNQNVSLPSPQTTVQGTPVSAGTFFQSPAGPVVVAPTTPVLNTNALPNGLQARQ